jgi:hypothetical protein
MLGCKIDFNTDIEKQRFIEKTVNGFLNMELYDLVLMTIDYNEIFVRKTDKEVFQIYSLANRKRVDNLTYINLDQCGEILKAKHNIPNDDLIVFKIEYYSPNFKIPIIEYNIFGKGGRLKLNLNYCKSSQIIYYIPKELDDLEEFLYDPENKYYSDKCYSPTIKDAKTDIILYDRKDFFNKNNMSLCESICKFKGYINNQIECICESKTKFNSFLNINADKYKLLHRFEDNELKTSFNVWVIKCFLYYLSMETLMSNIISFIMLGIILIIVIGTVIFYVKEKYLFYGKIKLIIEGISLKSEFDIKTIKFKEKKATEESQSSKNEMFKNYNIFGAKKQKVDKEKKKDKSYLKFGKKGKKGKNESNTILTPNEEKITDKTKNINNKDLLKSKIEILKKTDNELNFLSYSDAIINDKRNIFEYYFSLIRTKNLLFFPFIKRNDFNPRTMKICFLMLVLGINITIIILFTDESNIHELYISNGAFNIFFHLQKIIYATIVTLLLKYILLWLIFPEKNFLSKKKKIMSGKPDKRNKDMAVISLKCACFFPISIIFLFFFWFYAFCFGAVFKNSQNFILISTIISFIIQLITPFAFNIIPAIFRVCSLKGGKRREYLYRFSQYLQLI